MRNILLTITLLAFASVATAKDVCFTYDNGDPLALTMYRIKAVKVTKGQAERLTGVAVMPNVSQPAPLMVEGTALGLTYGHINYYLKAYNYDGTQAAAPVYVMYANQPSYSGTPSKDFKQVWCDGFPDLANQ